MNMLIKILIPAIVFFIGINAQSQTIDEGRKFMYYERYNSARQVFEKLVAAKPDAEDAVYWLGQSLILSDNAGSKDWETAKNLYLNTLSRNPNSALLLAGVGHMELMEGKTKDARSHFETAISLSQAKNISVLNAIGFANGNPDAKNGDAAYAIEKLKMATQIKGFKDPDVYINMGDAYRKFADGGNAILCYEAALKIDPSNAKASYRIGRVYQSQGIGQKDIFLKYFNEAIQKDSRYGPVYATLFNFYYDYDTREAENYLNMATENMDADARTCYYRALLQYRMSMFQLAVNKADECIKGEGANPYPNLFGLKALAYNRLGDSANVKSSFEEYFRRQSPEKIGPGDYVIYANNLLKFPGMEAEAGKWIDKAVASDSIEANKVSYLKSIATQYESKKSFRNAADWYNKILSVKKNYGKTDMYNAGYNYFRSGSMNEALVIFTTYTEKYPEDIFGYYMQAKANAGLDTSGSLGLAVPFYEKAISIGEQEKDTAKVKDKLLVAYKYLTEYHYNVKKDQESALKNIEKAVILSPADDELKKIRDVIKNNDPSKQIKKKS